MFNGFFLIILCFFIAFSCEKNVRKDIQNKLTTIITPHLQYGYDLNQFEIKNYRIKRGDNFGFILKKNNLTYSEIFNILNKIDSDKTNINRLKLNRPYTLLFSKDTKNKKPKVFIYHKTIDEYIVIQLRDSIFGKTIKKKVKILEMQAAGVIEKTLYETILELKKNTELSFLLSEIYDWTIDFYRIQKGDKFKIIYNEKFIDDTISLGINKIKAAYFEHKGEPYYAFIFNDSLQKKTEYFDEKGKNLRQKFLKSPIKFGRITSKYSLRRRIAYYKYKTRPHRGTDFAAPVGTPIRTTADGIVSKASYTRNNGNYIKIKHNNTYSTQYLHMKKRKVRTGKKVKQGDIIGWVGKTGNTSGPHVCYRFWKNGRQVDPFKQKLPEANPISKPLEKKYFKYIETIKIKLDCIYYN